MDNEEIVENFDSDEENENDLDNQEMDIEEEQIDLENRIYDSSIYNFNYVYNFFKTYNILKFQLRCPVCAEIMKITKDNAYIDKLCFRCKKNFPKHDEKKSIRSESFIENVRINLVAIYFLIIDCFIYNISANKAFIEYKKFNEIIDVGNLSLNNIQKFYRLIRNNIKVKMHKEWKKSMLGVEPCTGGVPRVEIDESKIIGNSEKVYYMFGIIDRSNKNCRVFCVMDNRSRESLLPITYYKK